MTYIFLPNYFSHNFYIFKQIYDICHLCFKHTYQIYTNRQILEGRHKVLKVNTKFTDWILLAFCHTVTDKRKEKNHSSHAKVSLHPLHTTLQISLTKIINIFNCSARLSNNVG